MFAVGFFLTSSFHDWLDFIEEMMKGATVGSVSYITSSLHTHTRGRFSLSVSVISPNKVDVMLTNALSRLLVSDGQLLMCVIIHRGECFVCLPTGGSRTGAAPPKVRGDL